MSTALTIVAAVVTAILLIAAIIRVSAWITNRKPVSAFKKERPDATNINDTGFTP